MLERITTWDREVSESVVTNYNLGQRGESVRTNYNLGQRGNESVRTKYNLGQRGK